MGYPVQSHKITTADGYILTYFRIQAKGQTTFKPNLPVLYLQHGLIDSGDTWVVDDEKDAPGLLLANRGYDVWIGNARGTKYSLEHEHLDPKKHDFWKFSWQNMSHYDIPAAFQYIHDNTGQNITYIGHSQGGTMMFAALADHEPIVEKYLKKYIALSPVSFVSNVKSGPIKMMAHSAMEKLFEEFKIDSFLQPDWMESAFGHAFCLVFDLVCGDLLGHLYGADPEFDNYKQLNVILMHEPGGTSAMNMYHWRQLVLNGKFRKYDYGIMENMKKYGQTSPPDYDLSSIEIPVYLFFGQYDSILAEEDTTILLKSLSKSKKVDFNVYPANHMTWMWSKKVSFFWDDFIKKLEE
jgi:gastric triacylglycerol lipase